MEYNIGDVIKDEKRNLVITGKEKKKTNILLSI